MLQAQQESINDLKKIIAFLLKKSEKKTKSLKTKASSRKSKGKKEDENSTSKHFYGNEDNFEYENPESSSSEESDNSENSHVKMMNELEKRQEAISNQSNSRSGGGQHIRPSEIELLILSGSRHQPCKPLMVMVPRTNTYTISNIKLGM